MWQPDWERGCSADAASAQHPGNGSSSCPLEPLFLFPIQASRWQMPSRWWGWSPVLTQ